MSLGARSGRCDLQSRLLFPRGYIEHLVVIVFIIEFFDLPLPCIVKVV